MLGKTLFSKIANSIVLVLLLGYAAIKVLPLFGVELAAELVSKETVFISTDKFLDQQALKEKIATFKLDKDQLKNALSKNNIYINDFFSKVKMDFVIPQNLAAEKSLVIEFITESANPNFSVGYKNIAQQFSFYINDELANK